MKRFLPFLSVAVFAWHGLFATHQVAAQTMRVKDVVQQKDKWDTWIKEKKKLQISGRYEGRFSNKFRLLKLPVAMLPGRNTVLPPDIDRGQRIVVSGVLKKSGNRLEMTTERLAVGSTDYERLQNRIRRLPKNQLEAGFLLADEFAGIAKFYEDEDLQQQVVQLRLDTFQLQRAEFAEDPNRLLTLAVRGESLGIEASLLDAIRFQAVVLKSKQDTLDDADLLKLVRQFEGWGKPNPFLEKDNERRFLAAPASQYELANTVSRARMIRLFYRKFRLPQILRTLKPDGSNGSEIADQLLKELPEETEQIQRAKTMFIEMKLKEIPQLTRRQLEDLEVLLSKANRQEEMFVSIDLWLKAQEKRLDNGQLDGTIATADEYFYAFDRWKHAEHRSKGVDLYKKAFLASQKSAPTEAENLAATLKRYGWVWLHNQWMTVEAASMLPKNDIEVAMREGRVVPGMKVEQVLGALAGPPTRKVRVISAKGVHEIWIYNEAGATSIIVHLLRTKFEAPNEAIVTKVGKQAL